MDYLTVLGATKTSFDVIATALDLKERLSSINPGDREVDNNMLRLALLAADRNLAILDGVNLDGEDEALFGVAHTLELTSIATLFVNWPSLTPEPKLPTDARSYEKWDCEVKNLDARLQILANARYIVARTTALQAFATIRVNAPEALREIRVAVRLKNLRSAHICLKNLMCHDEAIVDFLDRRKRCQVGA